MQDAEILSCRNCRFAGQIADIPASNKIKVVCAHPKTIQLIGAQFRITTDGSSLEWCPLIEFARPIRMAIK